MSKEIAKKHNSTERMTKMHQIIQIYLKMITNLPKKVIQKSKLTNKITKIYLNFGQNYFPKNKTIQKK